MEKGIRKTPIVITIKPVDRSLLRLTGQKYVSIPAIKMNIQSICDIEGISFTTSFIITNDVDQRKVTNNASKIAVN